MSSAFWTKAFCRPFRARTCRSAARWVSRRSGLPYAADAAITRHLARFLRQQAAQSEHGAGAPGPPADWPRPRTCLFNGGVLRAGVVRKRILDVLNGWLEEEGLGPAVPLTGEDLMHAVARGAAYYGLARAGRGVRIRGGVPRTYYVGIESSMPAVPGMRAPLKALTVAPFGMEEGTSADLRGREFGLIVGEPAEFRFFQSAVRKNDAAGTLLDDVGDELEELSPVEVTLAADGEAGQFVPVTLETVVTETGNAAALVGGARRAALEAGVQCAGEGEAVLSPCPRGQETRNRRSPRFVRDCYTGAILS